MASLSEKLYGGSLREEQPVEEVKEETEKKGRTISKTKKK